MNHGQASFHWRHFPFLLLWLLSRQRNSSNACDEQIHVKFVRSTNAIDLYASSGKGAVRQTWFINIKISLGRCGGIYRRCSSMAANGFLVLIQKFMQFFNIILPIRLPMRSLFCNQYYYHQRIGDAAL